MDHAHQEEEDFLQQQWSVLERHYNTEKPIVGRIRDIKNRDVIVDIGGIQGIINDFTFALTVQSDKTGMQSVPFESNQQALKSLVGTEIVVRICELDTQSHSVKLSQQLYVQKTDIHPNHVYIGTVVSLSPSFITLNVEGNHAKLPFQEFYTYPSIISDLSTHFYLGQEIQVIVRQKYPHFALVSLFNGEKKK